MQRNTRAINAPNVVLVLLGLFAGVHAYKSFLANEGVINLLLGFAFIPARYGGDLGSQFAFPYGILGDLWTPVTYMFLHADITHLLVNGFWMLAFGSAVAKRIGDLRFILFSIACGIAGVLVHLFLHFGELIPVIGASAAISGQMAGAIRFMFGASREGVPMSRDFKQIPLAGIGKTLTNPRFLMFMGVWIALNLLFGLGGMQLDGSGAEIAWEAHLGGFVCGLLIFGLFDRIPRPESSTPTYIQ